MAKPTSTTSSQPEPQQEGFERLIQLRYGEDMGGLAGLAVDLYPVTIRQVTLFQQPPGENETPDQVNQRRVGLLTGNPNAEHPDDREPAVLSWNLMRRGKPVPIELDAAIGYDIAVVTRILGDWIDGCSLPGPSDPKEKNSNGGSNTEPSSVEEELIPTESLP